MNEIFIQEEKSSSLKSLAKPVREKRVVKKRESVKYTENETLNDILNETVGLNDKSQEMDEYPTMGGGTYDTSKMAQAMGYGNMMGDAESRRKASAIQTAQAVGVNPSDPAVEDVMGALTKDYRGVMNALKKRDNK